jgi:hypothetical protein
MVRTSPGATDQRGAPRAGGRRHPGRDRPAGHRRSLPPQRRRGGGGAARHHVELLPHPRGAAGSRLCAGVPLRAEHPDGRPPRYRTESSSCGWWRCSTTAPSSPRSWCRNYWADSSRAPSPDPCCGWCWQTTFAERRRRMPIRCATTNTACTTGIHLVRDVGLRDHGVGHPPPVQQFEGARADANAHVMFGTRLTSPAPAPSLRRARARLRGRGRSARCPRRSPDWS